ncbi:signal peptide peptidase SppA [Methanofollis formosanus]|uniref:Signal peptide peptidase SppA n=1 Tax=Methanofollis formosanus TaxID=299308 RepID=A0A8G1A0R9_9EURY|nr:signal peptide peptidase SppA [Methanofollis formosanus]QYZ78578.1 signal peptide peptidase SppA [Methanofollis formosanus]
MNFLREELERVQKRRRQKKWLLAAGVMLFIAIVSAVIIAFVLMPAVAGEEVAVIRVEGELLTGDFSGGGYVGSEAIGRDLREAADDPSVEAVVLRINSPGGSPAAAQEVIRDLEYTRAKKPVVTSMGEMAASAAYLIAAHTDRIYLSPDTVTGSIGVIWLFPDESKWMEEEGRQVEVVKSGEQKDMTSPFRPLTDEERAYAQQMVDESFETFIADIMKERPVKRADVETARVIRGEEAISIGLADEEGNLFDAIDGAKTLAAA